MRTMDPDTKAVADSPRITSPGRLLDLARRTLRIEAEAVRALEDRLGDAFLEAVRLILTGRGRLVVSGMGKSGLIGKKIAATLASTGTPAFFMHPAEALHGDLGMVRREDVFLGISKSGETEELLRLVPAIRRNGQPFIALVGNPLSTLARNADVVLDASVAEEACPLRLAPTASTTAALALGDALAVCLLTARGFTEVDFAGFHPGGNLGRQLLLRVADVMRRDDLPIVGPDDDVLQVVSVIGGGRLGLAVVQEAGRILGVITDGDLRRAMGAGASFMVRRARDLMTRSPKTIAPDAMAVDARDRMTRERITALLVVASSEGDLEGILHMHQLNEALGHV